MIQAPPGLPWKPIEEVWPLLSPNTAAMLTDAAAALRLARERYFEAIGKAPPGEATLTSKVVSIRDGSPIASPVELSAIRARYDATREAVAVLGVRHGETIASDIRRGIDNEDIFVSGVDAGDALRRRQLLSSVDRDVIRVAFTVASEVHPHALCEIHLGGSTYVSLRAVHRSWLTDDQISHLCDVIDQDYQGRAAALQPGIGSAAATDHRLDKDEFVHARRVDDACRIAADVLCDRLGGLPRSNDAIREDVRALISPKCRPAADSKSSLDKGLAAHRKDCPACIARTTAGRP